MVNEMKRICDLHSLFYSDVINNNTTLQSSMSLSSNSDSETLTSASMNCYVFTMTAFTSLAY